MMVHQFSGLQKQAIIDTAAEYSRKGLGCSEALFQAAGEALLDEMPEVLKRAATPFSGGVVNGTEMCGSLTGGLMIIGAIYGRLEPAESRDFCKKIASAYVTAFSTQYGSTRCGQLKQSAGWGTPQKSCGDLIAGSTRLLLEVLSQAESYR